MDYEVIFLSMCKKIETAGLSPHSYKLSPNEATIEGMFT